MPIVGEFDAHESVAESDDGIEIQSVKCMGARGMTLGRGRNSDQNHDAPPRGIQGCWSCAMTQKVKQS
jgi:hypothetical protein